MTEALNSKSKKTINLVKQNSEALAHTHSIWRICANGHEKSTSKIARNKSLT
jgi:hypothetical protein